MRETNYKYKRPIPRQLKYTNKVNLKMPATRKIYPKTEKIYTSPACDACYI